MRSARRGRLADRLGLDLLRRGVGDGSWCLGPGLHSRFSRSRRCFGRLVELVLRVSRLIDAFGLGLWDGCVDGVVEFEPGVRRDRSNRFLKLLGGAEHLVADALNLHQAGPDRRQLLLQLLAGAQH